MVKKKTKTTKKLRHRAHMQDVQPSTGLPPLVEGQLRCYLKLCVNQILWMIPNPPDVTHVCVKWWGEEGAGTLFRPVDVKKGKNQVCQTTTRYAIRSGPKQFASYLSDMVNLHLEVLSGPMRVPVGRAQVSQIGQLSPSKPINGFFPVSSADEEKVAELQVSISLESIMASYDSMSSVTVPTPDIMSSFESYPVIADSKPINPPRVQPMPPPRPPYSSAGDPFASPVAPKQGGRVTPQGIDAKVYASNPLQDSGQSQRSTSGVTTEPRSKSSPNDGYPRDSRESTLQGISTLESQVAEQLTAPSKSGFSWQTSADTDQTVKGQEPYPSGKSGPACSRGSGDLVSVLLDRGNKLREAMIKSTLPSSGVPKVSESGSDVESRSFQIFSPLKREGSTGDLFKEILQDRYNSKVPAVTESQDFSDAEGKAVDLVLGPGVTGSQIKALTALAGNTPPSSVSGDDFPSDPDNPLHDESILQELFYNAHQTSDDTDGCGSSAEMSHIAPQIKRTYSNSSLASLEDAGNRRPPSRRSSASSLGMDCEPTHDAEAIPLRKKRERRGLKKSRKGKQKSHVNAADGSDSDSMNLSRMSEASKVSFDPVPSDAEETGAGVVKRGRDGPVEGMSVERLTLLGRVNLARVMIGSLVPNWEEQSQDATPAKPKGKAGQRGKPPRPSPKPKRNCTYFVEYNFPVVATSRDKYQPNAMATEVMRVASKKVADGAVSFGHRSVFPVLFDGDSIEKWWKSALLFKVYSRTPGQKVPKLMGMCSVPLKSVLKSEALYLDRVLDVKDRSQGSKSCDVTSNSSMRQSDWPVVGNLKVGIELASDSRDFATALAKTRLAEMTNPKVVPISKPKPKPQVASVNQRQEHQLLNPTGSNPGSTTATQTEPRSTDVDSLPLIPGPDPRPNYPNQSTGHTLQATVPVHYTTEVPETYESLTLHTLLMIPEAQGVSQQGVTSLKHGEQKPSRPPQPNMGWTGRDLSTRNLYLVCRMFWCDDIVRSNICWGSHDPDFKFVQMAPVLLTASLLERLRNNFMVVEVWDKKTTSENDQLVGIVKLPLHQFYMSYRDRKIAAALLRSQYPVVSVDADVPIMNPFSGTQFGQLKVLLAMGSTEQVSSLQRLKLDKGAAIAVAERPFHYLERHDAYSDGRTGQSYGGPDNTMEHIFEICMESIKGLKLLDNMIWGEADCFIQYHFPAQMQTKQRGGPSIMHAMPSLKTFRTATTLCVPDPVFNDVMRHKLVLPEGSPVQREILTACAGAGGGAGGVPFEVWCRYYHPNVRDQVIAKGMLPLAKLCAMVTMQTRGEPSVQTFNLPLTSLVPEYDGTDMESAAKVSATGLLEVTVNYKTHVVKGEAEVDPTSVSRSIPSATVCISVGVVRASGLKAAATALARQDNAMQYASEVGVNSYVRVQLSFLKKEDERITRTIARTFAPEFSYFMDFPCPLLWTEPGSDALSLAEILEHAEVTFEIWHQAPSARIDLEKQYVYSGSSEIQGRHLVTLSGDVLLGTVTVPLRLLLTRKTGLSGWYPLNLPSVGWDSLPVDRSEARRGNRGLDRVVGGVELSVKFAHQEDLERVVHAARGVGWAPDFDVEHRDWESADEFSDHYHHVTVAVDLACFPSQSALIVGQNKLDPATYCYIRYKLYDKGPTCSKLSEVQENEEGYIVSALQHSKIAVIAGSAPFSWYLREERLEIQVWVTYHPEEQGSDKKRPRHRDKLIGSAYLDLAALADTRRRQHRVSGVYSLFKPGTSSLGGACIQAHVALKPHCGGYVGSSEDEDEEVDVKVLRKSSSSPSKRQVGTKHAAGLEESFAVDLEGTFAVHISIERAFHLPQVTEKRESHNPSCYVSYQTSDSKVPTYTDIFPASTNPVWNYEHDTRLDKQSLVLGPRTLVFKVWHKPTAVSQAPDKSTDKVLGFVSVDMAPLTAGFQQLCGWYNIMDFNGQCQGQIKVSITPQEPLLELDQVGSSQPRGLGSGGQLPSHLAWFPDHMESVVNGSALPHFEEHFVNVKKHHEHLQSTMHQMGVADPNLASRSILFNNLRSNMQELDTITSRLKQKLVLGPAPASYSTSVPVATRDDPMETYGMHSIPARTTAPTLTSSALDNQSAVVDITTENLKSQNGSVANERHLHFPALVGASLVPIAPHPFPYQNTGATEQSKEANISKAETEVSMYTQTLQNAQNLLQAVNQHAKAMSDAAHALSGSGQSESELGHAAPPGVMPSQHITSPAGLEKKNEASGRTLDATDGDILDDGDDTFDQVWREYENNQLSSQLPSEISDVEEASIILPRPLNDVSSANFDNGILLASAAPFHGDATASTVLADDSFFGIPVSKAVTLESAGNCAELDLEDFGPTFKPPSGESSRESSGGRESYKQTNDLIAEDICTGEPCPNHSPLSEHDESGPEGNADFQHHSARGSGFQPICSDSQQSDATPVVAEADLVDEDPSQLKVVSRTSLRSPKPQSGRQAAMFRREYQRHRVAGSSSEEEDEETENRGRPRRRKKRTSNSSSRVLEHIEMEYEERVARQQEAQSEAGAHQAPQMNGNFGFGSDYQMESGLDGRQQELFDGKEVSDANGSEGLISQALVNGTVTPGSGAASDKSTAAKGFRNQTDDLGLGLQNLTYGSDISSAGSVKSQRTLSVKSQGTESVKSQGTGSIKSQGTESVKCQGTGSVTSRESGSLISRASACPSSQPSQLNTNEKHLISIQAGAMPNFFLPRRDLEQTMRALRTTAFPAETQPEESETGQDKSAAAREMLDRFSGKQSVASRFAALSSARKHGPPSSEQTDRIAKIFAQKFTS